MQMSDKEFKSEMNYQVTMSYVRQLKENGTISNEEYRQIDTIMLEKYRPVLGTLLSGNRLT
jgi:hypothetical protein